MEIGTSLRKLRNLRGLSAREISEKIGVSHSTYVDWEHDKSSPSLRSFNKVAAAFQVCPVELLSFVVEGGSVPLSIEDKADLAELKQTMEDYKDYCRLLRGDKEKLESELQIFRARM